MKPLTITPEMRANEDDEGWEKALDELGATVGEPIPPPMTTSKKRPAMVNWMTCVRNIYAINRLEGMTRKAAFFNAAKGKN